MIQLQVLNYIINNKDSDFLTTWGKDYFFNYEDEYNFILSHYNKHKNVPDLATVLEKFTSFEPIDVSESKEYLEQRLYEDYVFNKAVEIINNSSANFSKDAVKTKDELIDKLKNNIMSSPNQTYGVDIIKNAQDRYNQLLEKKTSPEKYMFSTNSKEFDYILNGGLRRGEELLVIYARTNNAKTWIAEWIAVNIWAGKKDETGKVIEKGVPVGFFSPEMSPTQIGYRFDTLFKNFSNYGITGADLSYNIDEYKTYIDKLTSKHLPMFSVVTPLDFPNKRVTITELRKWILRFGLQCIVIDGMTYLTNERGNNHKNTTENLTDISEDLMTLSIELGIPIIAVLQANRQGARDSEGEVSTEAPELDTIRGSDGISFNASRALSIYKAKDIVKLYLSKNRYGEKGQHIFFKCDINTGNFIYEANPKDGIPDWMKDPGADTFSSDLGTAI